MISLEYLAGFFDGEGTITLTVARARGLWLLIVSVSQTDFALLSQIAEVYGGAIQKKTSPRKSNHAQGWELRWHGKDAIEFLEKIAPHLRLKQEQAELVLANKEWLVGVSGHKLSEEVVKRREEVRLELASLKSYSKILANVNQIN